MELDWITPQQVAEKWVIIDRRVQALCANCQIAGAVRLGRGWLIPKSTPKPPDGRAKNGRAKHILSFKDALPVNCFGVYRKCERRVCALIVQIAGTGCPKCKKLHEMAMEATHDLGIVCNIEKVEKVVEIAKLGVTMTPALLVDGKILLAGSVPTTEKVKELLQPFA